MKNNVFYTVSAAVFFALIIAWAYCLEHQNERAELLARICELQEINNNQARILNLIANQMRH